MSLSLAVAARWPRAALPLLMLLAAGLAAPSSACTVKTALGCFQDSLTKPVMKQRATITGLLTLEICAQACYALGYTVAGAEGGNYCFCDNTAKGSAVDNSACSSPCSGDSNEFCGGSLRLYEYTFDCSVPPPSPSPPGPSPPGPAPPGPPSPPTPAPKHGTKKGLSGGGIILLVFFLGLVLPYVVFGALYMKYKHGASGADLVIHREFWASFPGLVKDGFTFTFGRCFGGKQSSYASI